MPKIDPLIPKDIELLNILSEEEVKEFKLMKQELKDTWKKKQIFRTETEMRISVLNDLKHPTPASKYWQAVREQSVMFEQVVFLSFDYRKNEVEIKKIEKKLKEEDDDLERELLQIQLEERLFTKANMELTAKDRMRELKLWSNLKNELIKEDPNFDKQNVDTHQKESLPIRLIETAKHFNSAADAGGAKNLAAQLMTIDRLKNQGFLSIDKSNQNKKLENDKNDK